MILAFVLFAAAKRTKKRCAPSDATHFAKCVAATGPTPAVRAAVDMLIETEVLVTRKIC